MNSSKQRIMILGTTGTIGALLILAADLIYNLFGGDKPGPALYYTTYAGIFCFPLWWAGIWIIYKGLQPAGFFWSALPCLLFAYLVSTVNVSGHALYPYKAAFSSLLSLNNELLTTPVQDAAQMAQSYTSNLLTIVQPILEVLICLWITIPIIFRKTLFPRWLFLFIPIFPTLVLVLANLVIPGIYDTVSPYIASVSMVLIFLIGTKIMYEKTASLV